MKSASGCLFAPRPLVLTYALPTMRRFLDSLAPLDPLVVVGQDVAVTTSDPDFLARWEQLGRFFMGTSDVHLAADRLCQKLDELAIPYAICGGLAVNAHGHQRATTDVDVLLTFSAPTRQTK